MTYTISDIISYYNVIGAPDTYIYIHVYFTVVVRRGVLYIGDVYNVFVGGGSRELKGNSTRCRIYYTKRRFGT